MADTKKHPNNVDFIGRCNFSGKQTDYWYRNNIGVHYGKDKETGKGQYFNASFFLKPDQFDLIPHIESKGTINIKGALAPNDYVDKDGVKRYGWQVNFAVVSIVEDTYNANIVEEETQDYSDDMEPF